MTAKTAQERFKAFLTALDERLATYDLVRSGSTFYQFRDPSWLLVQFQKSLRSTSDVVRFTANIGLVSETLRLFMSGDRERLSRRPTIHDAVLTERLGFFAGDRDYDAWWTILPDSDLSVIVEDVGDILVAHALPYLSSLRADAALAEMWASGRSPGLTDLERLMNLSALALRLHEDALARTTMDELRGMAQSQPSLAPVIVNHLARLEGGAGEALKGLERR
jgi:hypothetical protein